MDVSMARRLWRYMTRRGGQPAARVSIAPAPARPVQRRPNEVYTPTQPRTARSLFIGRQDETETIVQGLVEDHAHVVLYSERGRGKTSLSNVIVEALRRNGMIVARTQCDAGSTFDSFMRGLMRNLPASLIKSPAHDGAAEGCEAVLPRGTIRPDDVVAMLPKLRVRRLICVIDEFDRVLDPATRTVLADTIKQVSDRGLPLLFMIIGVSDSLEQLIGQHPSIQRNVVAVPLPLMSDEDIAAVLETGAREADLLFPPGLVADVAAMSRGMPYVVHLLGLRIAQAAGRRGSRMIEQQDFEAAVRRLLTETPPAAVQCYDELTANGADPAMEVALDGVARCRQDVWGHMAVSAQPGGVSLGGVPVAQACWARLRDAGVVRPCVGKPGHVAYGNRALIQYVLLRGRGAAAAARSEPSNRIRVMTGSGLQG